MKELDEGARAAGYCEFWRGAATKYGRINMFKIFMCPSAGSTIIAAAALCLLRLDKNRARARARPRPLPAAAAVASAHLAAWHCLALSGHVLAMNRARLPGTCVYFYLRQWQKVNEN